MIFTGILLLDVIYIMWIKYVATTAIDYSYKHYGKETWWCFPLSFTLAILPITLAADCLFTMVVHK